MVEPVSIAASVLTLLAAANHVAVGLNKLASLRGAPDVVKGLNNELEDLRGVLYQAEPLLRKHGDATVQSAIPNTSLRPNIDRAKDRLAELETIVGSRLLARMGAREKLGWMFEQDKVQRALGDIQAARANITAMLGVINGSSSFRVEAKLQDVQYTTQQVQAQISQTMVSQGESLEKRLTSIIEAQQRIIVEQQQRFHERLQKVEESIEESSVTSVKPSGDTLAIRHSRREPSSDLFAGDSFSALKMRFLRQTKCEQWCDCRCHTYKRASATQGLQSILGTLFLGYTGLPIVTPECSNSRCRRCSESYVQFNYFFPSWFLTWAVSAAIRTSGSKIPEIKLRVLNLRGTYEKVFQSAISGDADSIQFLFKTGRASVRDISDDSGHSPLHCAVINSNVEVIKVLLQWKAEVYLENRKQETPYDIASDNIFYFQGTPQASSRRMDEIRELFPITEWVEERRLFTHIHKIVLGLLDLDLEKALLKDPSGIDRPDADGRTPISWAAARGDSQSVELLLRYGASPDSPDRIGQGPLRQSLKADNAACLRLLLLYSVRVDQRDDWSQTCLLAAHYYPDPVSFTLPLLEAGAHVNARCSQGRFPLMEAVSKNNVAAVKLLLDYGANVNFFNNAGATALHEGVRYNSHEALTYFLEEDIDHTLRDTNHRTVLHYAAEYADVKTLTILSKAGLCGLNPDDEDRNKRNPVEIAEARQVDEKERGLNTVDSHWIVAFYNLLENLRAFQTPKSVPSYSESLPSEDIFLDAAPNLDLKEFERLADMAEGGKVPRYPDSVGETHFAGLKTGTVGA